MPAAPLVGAVTMRLPAAFSSLTAKANKLMPKLEILWNSCETAILDIMDKDLAILTYLDNIDLNLEKTSFHYRFKQEYLKSIKQ